MSDYPTFLGPEWVQKHKTPLAVAGTLVVLAIVVISFLSWANGIHNDGFRRQREVVQEYNNYQTSLSTCLDNSSISTQMAQAEYSQFRDVMTAVIAARYQTPTGQQTGASDVLGGGALISALQEAYPDVDRSLWKQAMSTAVGCRNQVANEMNKLQYVAASFDSWTNTGNVFARHYHRKWPNGQLKIQGLTGTLTGQDALDFLTQPVLTTSATQAVRTHTMPSQQLFPSSSPTP
jgi:hypothetical protein